MTPASSASLRSLLPSSDSSIMTLARTERSQAIERYFGLFPNALDLTEVYRILDLACGQGDWAIEAARYLEVATLGLEQTSRLIQEAQAYARVRSLADLASFEVMNLSAPLALEDETFDLVHGAFLSEHLPQADWPALLAECMRVLTPGGFLLLSEMRMLSCSSTAGTRLSQVCTEALCKLGIGWSTDGHIPGLLHTLPALLQDATETHEVEHELHLLHYRSPQTLYADFVRTTWRCFHLLQPLLTEMGYGSQEELVRLCDQFAIDVRDESFCAAFLLVRLWCRKPKEPMPVPPRSALPLLLPLIEQ